MKQKYKLGMPTLIELDSLSENAGLCRKLNLDLLEINMNLPQFQVEELQDLPIDHLEYSIHLPEDLDVWSYNEEVRNAHIETVLKAIRFSKEKGIKILNMHMNLGIHFTLPQTKLFLHEKYVDRYIKDTINFGQQVNEEISGSEVRIYIENTGIYDYWFIRKAVEELLKVEGFMLTWDVGHDYSSGNKDFDFLTVNKDKIKHLHLHDALGKNNHLPLGSGDINLDTVFSMAGRNVNTIIFETKTVGGLRESVQYYRDFLLSL